jgi:hypothetical protein
MAEMTYNITLTANHQSLTAEYLPLAAESVQYLTAKVVCETEDWAGREIKAMFGQGCTVHEVSVTGGEITAKQQLNLTAGDWCVWLVGNSARDGEVIPRITTNVAHISVAPTGGTEGNPFPTTPPTVEEQLRADMGNLADLTTEDKSSLVAAINEAAASGGSKDAVTYTPQTLTEGQQKQARTNIGAEKAGTGYTKPASGIPKSDLAEDVQTSLAKADTAISLGLTAAIPGQIIKVKAVQDGKPTEWEAVDMPSEGVEWYEVIDMETAEDVNDLIISADKNGRPISGYHALAMVLCFMIPADSTQTSVSGSVWVYPTTSDALPHAVRIITNVAAWKTTTRTFSYLYAGSNRTVFLSGMMPAGMPDGSYNFDGIRLHIHNADDHLPTGTKVRCLVLSKGWTA